MSSIGWTAIEDALWDAVKAGSSLADNCIVWDYYKQPRPAATFAELSITEITAIGHDRRIYDDAPDPQPGAELRVRSRGMRTFHFIVQLFGATDVGNIPTTMMADVVAQMELSSYAIDVAGAGLGEIGSVQTIAGRRGGTLEPRARCEFTFHCASEIESRETYIETVTMTTTAKSATGSPIASVTQTVTLT